MANLFRTIACELVCVFLTAVAHAQVRTSGQIIGTVTDPSGAFVPGAEIQVEDVGTTVRANAKSNRQGGFVFPALQPGRYRLVASATEALRHRDFLASVVSASRWLLWAHKSFQLAGARTCR